MPPTAKKIEPLAISLLSAEAPTRLSELKARIGEPRWSIEAIKPMPISTHKPNMQAITRCWAFDEFTGSMIKAINSMMMDMLAAIARKDYQDRRRRQAEGIKKAKEEGKYRGRQVDSDLHEKIYRK